MQADSIVPNPGNPQSLNRYTYGLNNPLRYTDRSGHVPIDWIIDLIGVGYDVYQLIREPSWENARTLVVDVGLWALPYPPAAVGLVSKGGKAAKLATHWDEAMEAIRIAGRFDEAVDAVSAARRLREVGLHADEAGDLIKAIARQSTHGAGDRVVLGPWKFKDVEGFYIKVAEEEGGIYFKTAEGVYEALGKDPEFV